ncbi:RDD family protein [Streptomyces sp. NPDC091209]|uniref:RDD family protein n=1 Tax=Streptomyces sp. NPDC091209 TaxID=3365974 RepID=UPI00381D065B
MSAPTPAPGDDRPREGYYPDPSIPGYVRYWNGAAWVPGTSRPAPSGGEALAPPPGVRPARVPAPAPSPEFTDARGRGVTPAAEETGPHFFDEDPQPRPATRAESQHGSRPEPAAAWGADRSQQSGFGSDQDRRVSWGAPQASDPRDPRAAGSADAVIQPDGAAARTDGTTTIPPADSGIPRPPATGGSVVFRRPTGPVPPKGPESAEGAGGTGGVDGTGRTGDASSRGADGRRGPGAAAGAGPSGAGHSTVTPGTPDLVPAEDDRAFRAPSPRTERQSGARGGSAGPAAAASAAPAASGPSGAPTASGTSSGGGFGTGQAARNAAAEAAQSAAAQAAARASAAQAAPTVPQQPGDGAPMASGAGGGQPSWAQQVHQLAGDPAEEGQRVPQWKPPVEDVFQAAARRQSEGRPAGLGRRLAARLVDTVVLAGVTAAAAVPLGTRAVDHINEKIDAARLSGEKVTVWLLDGTTVSCLGAVLAVLLLFGVLYEVLPTAKWGRTPGKKLFDVEVRDIEGHEPPTFGRALGRWLVLSVPCLLLVGFVGVLWCLFDKPWSQCWHDKAAHTFVAGPAR